MQIIFITGFKPLVRCPDESDNWITTSSFKGSCLINTFTIGKP